MSKSDKYKNKYTTQNLGDLNERRIKNMENKDFKISNISDVTFSNLNTGSKLFTESLKNMSSFTFTLNPYTSSMKEEVKVEEPKRIMKPKEIKAHLDQHIIGQEEAKIALSVAVYNHYHRINAKIDDDGIDIQKSNILMIGNSGCGKTLLAQTIAKILDVPFVSVDATSYTPTGVVGKDVEEILNDLLTAAKGDKQKAERGIIYIDEFDKLSHSGSTRVTSSVKGILGGETQSVFLKLLEGESIDTKNGSAWGSSSTKINTKNILFICGGAFAGIEELIKQDSSSRTLGFSLTENKILKENDIDVWDKIGAEQIIKYGMMPEIVGRLPVILKLRPLEKNDLVHILTEPKNAIIKQYKKMLSIDGIVLDFTQDALETIAEMAIYMKTGARGLRGIVENIVTKIIFNLPDDEYERKCIVTGDCIKNNVLPELRRTVNDYGIVMQ